MYLFLEIWQASTAYPKALAFYHYRGHSSDQATSTETKISKLSTEPSGVVY
jgi:hypothetical protein